jgi:hypothetical protein
MFAILRYNVFKTKQLDFKYFIDRLLYEIMLTIILCLFNYIIKFSSSFFECIIFIFYNLIFK